MLHGVDAGRARSVHRIRVAARRLRELLPVLQLQSNVTHKLGRRLRRVTRQLGVVREVDALIALLDEMQDSGGYDNLAVACVRASLDSDRSERRQQASAKELSEELHQVAAKLEEVAESLPPGERERSVDRGWRWAIDARVRHRAGKLKEAVAAAGNVYLAGRVHAVRIAIKKFRYAVELESEASSETAWTPQLVALKRRQQLLGRLHDRQVLVDRVRQVQAALAQPEPGVWRALDAMLASLENECRRMHARYLRDAPALVALCDEIAAAGEDARTRRRAV
jgi:CHAD domain-containing protein